MVKAFQFLLGEARGIHHEVRVRFGCVGQAALLGTITVTREDWDALAACSSRPWPIEDVIEMVPPGQPCPGSGAPARSSDSTTGMYELCVECSGLHQLVADALVELDFSEEAARAGIAGVASEVSPPKLADHAWPHRWHSP